jgi:hypothetical protein
MAVGDSSTADNALVGLAMDTDRFPPWAVATLARLALLRLVTRDREAIGF